MNSFLKIKRKEKYDNAPANIDRTRVVMIEKSVFIMTNTIKAIINAEQTVWNRFFRISLQMKYFFTQKNSITETDNSLAKVAIPAPYAPYLFIKIRFVAILKNIPIKTA